MFAQTVIRTHKRLLRRAQELRAPAWGAENATRMLQQYEDYMQEWVTCHCDTQPDEADAIAQYLLNTWEGAPQ